MVSKLGGTGRACALATCFVLAGCATSPAHDPLEGYNRVVFGINEAVDNIALKPAAHVYSQLPAFFQAGVYNFFANLADVGTGLNNLLQGKIQAGVSDFGRVGINTTLGLGGLFDVASAAGVPRHVEDFGQTLGQWGVEPGPYFVLPLLGPSTVRDALALPLDFSVDPWSHKRPVRYRNAGAALRAIDERASLLDTTSLLDDAAFDRYQFVRDAYLQRRRSQVYDGDPPPSDTNFGLND